MEARRQQRSSRSRWAAVGAAIAVSLGAGTVLSTSASVGSGERAVFVAIAPCRAVDTRSTEQVGPRGTPLGANETYATPIVGTVGNCTIPADASAVVLNLAIVHPTAGSYLTVFPTGGSVPLAANLNFVAGQAPVSNAATVDVGAGGRISFYNLAGTVDVTADISGYYVDHTHDDRYALLGHTHDDRYPQKQQTIVVDGGAAVMYGQPGVTTNNGCLAVSATDGVNNAANSGRLAVPLPTGTLLRSVRLVMLDGVPSTAYFGSIYIVTVGSTGYVESGFGTGITGGTQTIRTVTHTFTPAQPVTLGENTAVILEFSLGSGTYANGLCQLQLDVTLP